MGSGVRRSVVVFAVVLLCSVVPAEAARRPIQRFTACMSFSTTSPYCGGPSNYAVDGANGGRIDFRAQVVPAHVGARANLMRIAPGGSRWTRFATVSVNSNGRMHFLWRTRPSDIRGINRDYRFQFRIPGHSTRSPVLRVAVGRDLETE